MDARDKKALSKRDICTKFITPALERAGWDIQTRVREEVCFTAGRIIVRGKLHFRGRKRRADYILSFRKNQPIAVIEAKDNQHSLGDGIQQGLAFSEVGLFGNQNTVCKPTTPKWSHTVSRLEQAWQISDGEAP